MQKKTDLHWRVYIVACADGTLYTGITKDLSRRLDEHNQGLVGAKYTRSRRPVRLVYYEKVADRSAAAKREYAIKKLPLAGKVALVDSAASITI
ncbi:MAG: GIY-YIG nuclease family protein, partial [Desulfobulbaceae bacterium]|nr:GIY-YIG nuclease family protein [Desulfobulbaceae bacterium]